MGLVFELWSWTILYLAGEVLVLFGASDAGNGDCGATMAMAFSLAPMVPALMVWQRCLRFPRRDGCDGLRLTEQSPMDI